MLLTVLFATLGTANATVIDGRLTTSALAYEASPTDSASVTHLRTYAALRLKVTDLGDRRVSLTTYLRATTDLSERAGDDPALRPVSTYLRFKDDHLDLRLGRQYLYAGVGYGQVDGVRADFRIARMRLTLHGGALVPVYGEVGLGSFSDAHLWGLRLSTDRFAGVDVAISYADRERDPLPYKSAGQYSGFVGQPESVHRQLVGIDARRRFGVHNVHGRLDWDLVSEHLRRAEVGARVAVHPRLSLSADWLRREPALFTSSILSVFAAEGFDEVTLRARYQVHDKLSVGAHVAAVTYDTDDSQRLGVSASFGRHLTLGYSRSQGYAGGSDGLSGSLLYSLSDKLMLRGQLGIASYERVADDREDLLSGVAAATYRASRQLSIDAQLQAMRNPAYDADLRLLLRASWRFRS
ncbi:MAG: hypothetical protein HOC05_03170 [Gemmatimonadetes bacterium]|nr:hypothetical protein [Gemmatimonadota bacterium]